MFYLINKQLLHNIYTKILIIQIFHHPHIIIHHRHIIYNNLSSRYSDKITFVNYINCKI